MKYFSIPIPSTANPNAVQHAFNALSDICGRIGCDCNLSTPGMVTVGHDPTTIGPETLFTMGAIYGQALAEATIKYSRP